MGVAADCKDLCQGVVLVNSAGPKRTIVAPPQRASLARAGSPIEHAFCVDYTPILFFETCILEHQTSTKTRRRRGTSLCVYRR